MRGNPPIVKVLPSVAATGAEVALLLDALKMVPATAPSAPGASHDDVVARMQAFIAKMEAQASASDGLQQQLLDMQKRESENVEALQMVQEQMDQDGDSDAESEAPSLAGEEARKKKRERRAKRGDARKKVGEVLSKFSSGKACA